MVLDRRPARPALADGGLRRLGGRDRVGAGFEVDRLRLARRGAREHLPRRRAPAGPVEQSGRGESADESCVRAGRAPGLLLGELALAAGAISGASGADGKGAAPETKLNAAMLAEAVRGHRLRAVRIPSADGRSCRRGSSCRPASIPRRSTRRSSSSTAGRRCPAPTPGPTAGTWRASRATATSSTRPNPRGSPGWGQKFVDEISGDWGGKVYDDLMRQADDLESLPYVDKKRIGAAGASYRRLHGRVDRGAHDALRDADLPRRDRGPRARRTSRRRSSGSPASSSAAGPGKPGSVYEKWNPIRFADKFQTPMLVITNEKDYRVPFEQGLQLFTALQLKGVPSKLLVFPDEGHWVLKPGNALVWHNVMMDWLHEVARWRPCGSEGSSQKVYCGDEVGASVARLTVAGRLLKTALPPPARIGHGIPAGRGGSRPASLQSLVRGNAPPRGPGAQGGDRLGAHDRERARRPQRDEDAGGVEGHAPGARVVERRDDRLLDLRAREPRGGLGELRQVEARRASPTGARGAGGRSPTARPRPGRSMKKISSRRPLRIISGGSSWTELAVSTRKTCAARSCIQVSRAPSRRLETPPSVSVERTETKAFSISSIQRTHGAIRSTRFKASRRLRSDSPM